MDLTDLSALLGEDVASESYADFWVVMPQPEADQPLGRSGAALVGEARRQADLLGCYVHAIVTSEVGGSAAIAMGADRVHVTARPVDYLASQQPEFVLFSQRDVAAAAYLAQRLQAGLITGVQRPLAVDPDTRALIGAHPVYGGDYFVDEAVTSPVKVATLDAAFFPQPYADSGRSGEVVHDEAPSAEQRVRDLGPAEYTPPAWRPLTKARCIVSGGRGLRDAAGFDLARQLAERLGAELAGDRSALSSGWIDEAHEVGVTGQEVAPDLYVAVGIAGDTIHNAAISGARQVVAIHRDPEAPIFQVADLAVVADPKEFLPHLLTTLAPRLS